LKLVSDPLRALAFFPLLFMQDLLPLVGELSPKRLPETDPIVPLEIDPRVLDRLLLLTPATTPVFENYPFD